MKVACVFTPWYRRESPAPELASMIALVKGMGHRVFVFDINNEIFSQKYSKRSYWKYFLLDVSDEIANSFFFEMEEIFRHYCAEIMSQGPDIIIFKPIANTYKNAIRLAQMLKQENSNKLIIFSGKYTINEQDIESAIKQQKDSPFDFLICGQDEVALPKLLEAIEKNNLSNFDLSFKRNGKVIDCICGPVLASLDALPFFDFSDFNLNSYKYPEKLEMFISRGCPWQCSFCISWMVEGKYRSMSGKRIFQEILYQLNFHNRVKHFRFCDNTINGNIQSLRDFCDLISEVYKKGFPKIEWSGDAMIRPEMTEELLLKMHEAGCSGIGYGLESGCQHVVKQMFKPFLIPLAERVIRDTHHASIKTSVNIMVGFPTETNSDFEETLKFIEKNKENIDEIRLTFTGCRVYPESRLHKDHKQLGITMLDVDNWVSNDGTNNYEERIRRAEEVCQLALSLGIELMVNSRPRRKLDLAKT